MYYALGGSDTRRYLNVDIWVHFCAIHRAVVVAQIHCGGSASMRSECNGFVGNTEGKSEGSCGGSLFGRFREKV